MNVNDCDGELRRTTVCLFHRTACNVAVFSFQFHHAQRKASCRKSVAVECEMSDLATSLAGRCFSNQLNRTKFEAQGKDKGPSKEARAGLLICLRMAEKKKGSVLGAVIRFVEKLGGTLGNFLKFFLYGSYRGTYSLPIGPRVVPFLGLPYRILHMNPKKELLWGLEVVLLGAPKLEPRKVAMFVVAALACFALIRSDYPSRWLIEDSQFVIFRKHRGCLLIELSAPDEYHTIYRPRETGLWSTIL